MSRIRFLLCTIVLIATISSLSQDEMEQLLGRFAFTQSTCPGGNARKCHGCATIMYWNMGPMQAVQRDLEWLLRAALTRDLDGTSLQREYRYLRVESINHRAVKAEVEIRDMYWPEKRCWRKTID